MPEGWRRSPTHHRKGIRKLYEIGYRPQEAFLISASYAKLKSYTPENGLFLMLPVFGICGATFGLMCLHINWGPLFMGNLTQKSSKFSTLSDTEGSYQNTCNVARTIIVLQTTQTSKDSYVYTSRIVKNNHKIIIWCPLLLSLLAKYNWMLTFCNRLSCSTAQEGKKSVHVMFAQYLLSQPFVMSNDAPNWIWRDVISIGTYLICEESIQHGM